MMKDRHRTEEGNRFIRGEKWVLTFDVTVRVRREDRGAKKESPDIHKKTRGKREILGTEGDDGLTFRAMTSRRAELTEGEGEEGLRKRNDRI